MKKYPNTQNPIHVGLIVLMSRISRVMAAILNHDISRLQNTTILFKLVFLISIEVIHFCVNLKCLLYQEIKAWETISETKTLKKWRLFSVSLPFFLQKNPKLILKPDFTDRNNTIGLLSIQNMAVDTKIRVLAWIQAKILKNTKIMAAILENGVCREG